MIRSSVQSRSLLGFLTVAIFLLSVGLCPSSAKAEVRPLGYLYPNFNGGRELSIANHRAYTFDGSNLNIVNISNPQQPAMEGFIPSVGTAWVDCSRQTAVQGHYLYTVASSTNAILIYDIADALHPQLVSTLGSGGIMEFAVSGNLLVISGSNNLSIYNISDPVHPQLMNSTQNFGYQVRLQGNILAVGGCYGVTVYSLANPASPVQIFSQTRPDTVWLGDFTISGQYLFVSYVGDSLYCFDLSHTPSPRMVARIYEPNVTYSYYRRGVWSKNNQVFVSLANSVAVYDADTSSSSLTYERSYYYNGLLWSIEWDGNMMCLLGDFGLTMINNYRTIGSFYSPGAMQNPVTHNGYCYIPNRWGGLLVTHIATDGTPTLITRYNPAGELDATDIAFRGDTAYVTSAQGLLYSLDVSSPATPRLLDTISLNTNDFAEPWRIKLQGTRAFVQMFWSDDRDETGWEMSIADVSNASNLRVLIGNIAGAGFDVDSNYVYIADGLFSILDYANVDSPRVVGTFDTTYFSANEVVVHGNRACISSGYQLFFLDVSNRAHPIQLGVCGGNTYFNNPQWVGNYVFTATGDYNSNAGTVTIWNVQNLEYVHVTDRLMNLPLNHTFSVEGNRLYVASETVFGVYDPFAVSEVKETKYAELPETYSLTNYPNPFNSTTTIRFSLPQAGQITLSVTDVLGRKVGDLFSGKMNAGNHSLQWNAVGYSSGTYYITVKSPSGVQNVRKAILLK